MFFGKITGPNKRALSNRDLHFSANNVQPGNAKSLGNGDYSAKFSITGDGPIQIVGNVRGEPSKNPLYGFALDAAQTRFENDGISANQLTIVAHDAYGSPVPNVAFQIEQITGDAVVPSSAKTDEYGFSHLLLTAGKKISPIHLRVYNEKVSSEHVLLQLPSDLATHIQELPSSGTQNGIKQLDSWKNAISSVVIAREGRIAEKVTSSEISSGDIKAIEITTQPSKIAPGGKVTLNIRATDNKGLPVPNARLKGEVTDGKISQIQDLGGGSYRATVTAKKGIKASSVKVSVTSANGKISQFVKLPVIKGSSDSVAKETVKPEVKPEAKPKKTKEPKVYPPVNEPMLRVTAGASFGNYAYQQMPTATGLLYQKSITFNGESGSEAAATGGHFVRVRGQFSRFHPLLRYLGAEAQFSSDRYAVVLEEFSEPVVDWASALTISVIPRYQHSFGNNQAHIGARLGFSNDDFMIFTQSETDNPEEVELKIDAIQLNGLFMGLDLGFELGMGLYGDITFDTALGGGVYQKLQVDLGYTVMDNIAVTTGLRSTIRELGIDGSNGPLGDVRDGNNALFIGATYQID